MCGTLEARDSGKGKEETSGDFVGTSDPLGRGKRNQTKHGCVTLARK